MAVKATAKYVRVAPRKAREAADLIRGKSVAEARSVLFFANRNSARVVAAVLDSAVANSEHNNALSADLTLKPDWRRWTGEGWKPNPPFWRPLCSHFATPSRSPILDDS